MRSPSAGAWPRFLFQSKGALRIKLRRPVCFREIDCNLGALAEGQGGADDLVQVAPRTLSVNIFRAAVFIRE